MITSGFRDHFSRHHEGRIKYSDVTLQYSELEQSILHITAVCAASLSVVTTIISLYWLLRMNKVFRHRLISLIILGDSLKAIFHLVFGIITLIDPRAGSETFICQASGFLVHLGTEIADFAVFFVSLHIALQVLRTSPTNYATSGLFRYRYFVYATDILVPVMLASLAFVQSSHPYISEGSFCQLPVQPFKYRLVLSWIPRYIIWFSILGLAIAMYYKINFKLNIFEKVERETSSKSRAKSLFAPHFLQRSADNATKDRIIRSTENNTHRLIAAKENSPHNTKSQMFRNVSWYSRSNAKPNLSNIDEQINPLKLEITGQKSSEHRCSKSSRKPSSTLKTSNDTINTEAPSLSTAPSSLSPVISEDKEGVASIYRRSSGHDGVARSRRRIRKQLRYLFLYPLVYLLIWLIPLIAHCFKYSKYYAAHPFYTLSLLTIFCRNIMGVVDCVVFCSREKPWLHIPNSNGTIIASFLWWQGGVESNDEGTTDAPRTSVTSTRESSIDASFYNETKLSTPSIALHRLGYLRRTSSGSCQEYAQASMRPCSSSKVP